MRYGYSTPDIHRYLADAFFGAGRYEDAVREYGELLKVNRDYVIAYFHIAEALVQLGREHEALGYFETFLQRWRFSGRFRERAQEAADGIKERLPSVNDGSPPR